MRYAAPVLLVAAAWLGAACELVVGNGDRTVATDADPGDEPDSADASVSALDDAAGPMLPTSARDASPTPAPGTDAAPPRPDAAPPPPPPATCPPPGAPADAHCCGERACVGLACDHCDDCRTKGCAKNEYCCATLNGGGHYKGLTCSALPLLCP